MAETVEHVAKRSRTIAARTSVFGCLAVIVALSPAQPTVLAADPSAAPLSPKQGHSPQRRLSLFAKDPTTWQIIAEGARGTLSFDRESGAFTFGARRLHPNSEYALVRHTDGAVSGDLLSMGTSGRTGELRLSGTWREWSGKIWLVSVADISVTGRRATLLAWHPEQILFEEKVLGIPCECDD